MIVLLMVACFFPLAIWYAYALSKKNLAAPTMLYSFFAGLAAVAIASVLQSFLDPVFSLFSGVPGLFVRSFIVSALIEESIRLLLVRFQPLRADSRSASAGLRAFLAGAVAIGFSFAAFENIIYAIRNPSSLILRSLTSVPLHASLALVCSMSFAGRFSGYRSFSAGYLVGSIALHGIYNICMDLGGVFVIPAVMVVVLVIWFAAHLWGRSGSSDYGDRYARNDPGE